MKNIGWDDLHIFLHVAQSGGLSGAARALDLSAPTVGRRMLALEQRSGQALFERSQTGYALTREGRALFDKLRVMQAAAEPVQQMLASQGTRPSIRLSAGTGTSAFLADHFHSLCRPGDDFRLIFMTSEVFMDIGHREVDLGIRNRPVEAGNLACRKLGLLRFAPYRSRSVPNADALEWVVLDQPNARHAAARWLRDQDQPIAVQASSVSTLHDLVRAGAGIGLMPCMIADCDPALARAGPVIEDLTETQYLVMHDDDRHLPHIRCVIDRIVSLYQDNADLLAGLRPLRP